MNWSSSLASKVRNLDDTRNRRRAGGHPVAQVGPEDLGPRRVRAHGGGRDVSKIETGGTDAGHSGRRTSSTSSPPCPPAARSRSRTTRRGTSMTKRKPDAQRRMSVVVAEDQLLDAYRRWAAAELGLSLDDERVERAAEDAYWNDGAPGTGPGVDA